MLPRNREDAQSHRLMQTVHLEPSGGGVHFVGLKRYQDIVVTGTLTESFALAK